MNICNVVDSIPKSILAHPVFNMILKNDFVIYGSILKDILAGKTGMDDYNSCTALENTISIYGKFGYREILERDIGEFIVRPMLIGNEVYSKTVFISYTLLINNIEFVLDVLYIKNNIIHSCIGFYNELLITVSIDKLQMNRCGISVIDNKLGTENPFMDILSEISKKEFSILNTINPFTKIQCQYLRTLRDLGYKNKNYSIIPCSKKDAKCNICYDTEHKLFSRLECKHIFHTKCLGQAIEEALKDSITFSCPYCSIKYPNYEVL